MKSIQLMNVLSPKNASWLSLYALAADVKSHLLTEAVISSKPAAEFPELTVYFLVKPKFNTRYQIFCGYSTTG